MHSTEQTAPRAIIAGVHRNERDVLFDTTDESMKELCELTETAGALVVGELVQNRPVLETGTYFGEGKLEELKAACGALSADMVVVDDGLSGTQIRNIESVLGGDVSVIDRNTLILDIFAQRAQSAEGKIQVELAQLRYLLPRLSGMGAQMSRLGAGIGTRGPGETKLETDRRHIRRRISALTDELTEIKKRRDLQRQRREKDGVLTAAIVGYTNAGKSTLLNKLTGASVTERDRLFETLDITSRNLELPDTRSVLVTDTVGFIRRLPHQFIEAFKSTLEQTAYADVLLHVVDASAPGIGERISVVDRLLSELDCEKKPVIAVLNKCDVEGAETGKIPGYEHQVSISARTGEGLDELVAKISQLLPNKKRKMHLVIPYSDGRAVSALHENEKVLSEDYSPEGTVIEALVDAAAAERYEKYERI